MTQVANTRAYLFSGLYRQISFGERISPNLSTIHGRACAWINERFQKRDRGSKFDQSAKWMALLPSIVRNRFLLLSGRDGILLDDQEAGKVVGSCFFQRHRDNTVHSFHYFLLEEERGKGLGSRLGHHFIEHARSMLDFSDQDKRPPCARIFAGGSENAERIYDSLQRHEERLGIQCFERTSKKGKVETGWVRFTTQEPRSEIPALLP